MTTPLEALACARTPRRWVSGIATASERAHELRIRGGWLRRFVEPPPSLREGPLLGKALADAVARLGRAHGLPDEGETPLRTPAADPARSRARSARPAPIPNAVPRSVPSVTPPRSRTRSPGPFPFADAARGPGRSSAADAARGPQRGAGPPAPLAFARFAAQPLLDDLVRRARAAPVTAVRPPAERSPAPAPEHSTAARTRLDSATPDRRSPAMRGTASPSRPAAPFDATPSAATTALQAKVLARARALDARAPAAFGGAAAIERDWSRSMLGPGAPVQLLERIAAFHAASVPPARPRSGNAGRGPAAHVDTLHGDTPRSGTTRTSWNADAASQRPAVTPLDPRRTLTAPSTPARVFADMPGAPEPAPFADASGTPALPPFAWPRSLAEPALAVAAGHAAARASSPAHETDSDLDLLSAKIERILAEQARRHGIDV
jgi:hypothetical protein